MTRSIAVMMLLSALCACPSPQNNAPATQTPPDTTQAPGARLKPQVLTGDDGLRIQTGRIVDTDFDVTCSPKLVGARLVCFPDAADYMAQLSGFADPECSRKAGRGNAQTRVLVSGGHIFKRGEALTQNFTKQGDGSCQLATLSAGEVSYAAGEDVTDTLVGLTEEIAQ